MWVIIIFGDIISEYITPATKIPHYVTLLQFVFVPDKMSRQNVQSFDRTSMESDRYILRQSQLSSSQVVFKRA